MNMHLWFFFDLEVHLTFDHVGYLEKSKNYKLALALFSQLKMWILSHLFFEI